MTKARRLAAIAKWINDYLIRYSATTEIGWVSTNGHIPGTRLRRPGKGRKGTLLKVFKNGTLVFQLNNAETYRDNSEAEKWLADELAKIRGKR